MNMMKILKFKHVAKNLNIMEKIQTWWAAMLKAGLP